MVDIMEQVHRVVPDLKLYVVGAEFYSPLLEEMKVRVRDKKMEETVKILPWLSHQEALGFLKYSQLYLTTSIYEGLPIAVLEAMALGKAVVASDVIGNRDCVKDGENGVLLPLEVKQFADTICRLLDDEEERRRMGKRSKEIFEAQFMIDHRIRQLEDIYSKIYRA
jgi:glycosyltransferase involved in cell wall biosynthesis